jgi:hypothetical protein
MKWACAHRGKYKPEAFVLPSHIGNWNRHLPDLSSKLIDQVLQRMQVGGLLFPHVMLW